MDADVLAKMELLGIKPYFIQHPLGINFTLKKWTGNEWVVLKLGDIYLQELPDSNRLELVEIIEMLPNKVTVRRFSKLIH